MPGPCALGAPAAIDRHLGGTLVFTVVLPAYNESQALPVLLTRLATMSCERFESALKVIVVDDGSADGTGDEATPRPGLAVRLIVHDRNRGLGAAVATGLLAALDGADDDDLIVTMDADNTHTPWLIPRLVELAREGNDVVVASRLQPGARVIGVPARRQLLSSGMSLLFRVVYPIRGVRDYSCGFRVYRAGLLREAFDQWGDGFISESGFSCMVDILMKLGMLGAIVTEAPPILRYDRKPGSSKMAELPTVTRTLTILMRRRVGRLD